MMWATTWSMFMVDRRTCIRAMVGRSSASEYISSKVLAELLQCYQLSMHRYNSTHLSATVLNQINFLKFRQSIESSCFCNEVCRASRGNSSAKPNPSIRSLAKHPIYRAKSFTRNKNRNAIRFWLLKERSSVTTYITLWDKIIWYEVI